VKFQYESRISDLEALLKGADSLGDKTGGNKKGVLSSPANEGSGNLPYSRLFVFYM
jgi:hypothetical protein